MYNLLKISLFIITHLNGGMLVPVSSGTRLTTSTRLTIGTRLVSGYEVEGRYPVDRRYQVDNRDEVDIFHTVSAPVTVPNYV